MMGDHLSILPNADDNSITYYVGVDPAHVAHLKNCTLICREDLEVELDSVEMIRVPNPQLEFYRLSASYKKDYLERDKLAFSERYKSYIHPEAEIGEDVEIGPGCVIAKVKIGDRVSIDPNCTIYAETVLEDSVTVEANTVIGATGVMWIWHDKTRVFLEQLGNVIVEQHSFIGSNVTLVRGSANESTRIGRQTCMAHGTKIGHGCQIGPFNHFANNVSFGGSVKTEANCFFGSGSTVAPSMILCSNVILGANSTIVKPVTQSGVYIGSPAVLLKKSAGKMSGVPTWDI